jgi:hypothetical protein
MRFVEGMPALLRLLVQPTTLLLLIYPLLDLVTRIYPPAGLVGYGWIVSVFLLVFVVAGRSLWGLVNQAREEHQWWTVGAVVVWWLFTFVMAFPARLLSDENIFEFGCPQIVFREASDFGFLSQCFIGYPTRSFLLQALPVRFFGFSPFIANIGASLLLFPGIVLLAQAIRIVTERARASDFITGVAMLFLFQCALLIRIIYYHDQTTHPVALTMIFTGLLALWLERSDRLAFTALLALTLVSTSMYPPILSVLGLLGILLGVAFVRKQLPVGSAPLLVVTGILAVVCFVQTLAYRLDIRLQVGSDHIAHLSERLNDLAIFLLTQSNGMWYAAFPFQILFLLFLLGGLLGRFGLTVFLFCGWSVALIFVSFFASGMSPELAFWKMTGMHRTAPLFPIFVLVVARGLSKRIEPYRLSKRAMIVVLLGVVLPGAWTVYQLPIPNLPPLSYRVWRVAQRVTPPGVKANPTLITRNDIPVLGELPKHYLYLNPERTFEYYAGSCLPRKPVPAHTLVVTTDNGLCQETPSREGFEEVAAWGELVLGEWQYTSNTIRVYRPLSSKR